MKITLLPLALLCALGSCSTPFDSSAPESRFAELQVNFAT